jgi:hypothetical protein
MGQNLTGQTIASTYEDLVQISGSARNFLTDGTGSNITSLAITASYANNADIGPSYNSTTNVLSLKGLRMTTYEQFQLFLASEVPNISASIVDTGDLTYISSYSFNSAYLSGTLALPNVSRASDYGLAGINGINRIECDVLNYLNPSLFFANPNVTSYYLPNVTSMGTQVFTQNDALTSISLPKLTGSISNGAFQGCDVLATVSIPSASAVGNQAFQVCGALNSLTFPNITSVGSQAFDRCTSLSQFNFPLVTTVGANAFDGCTSLLTVNLSGLSGSNALGGSPTNNNVFNGVGITGTITVPIFYQTNNGGNPDGDLQYLVSSKGWTVNYI